MRKLKRRFHNMSLRYKLSASFLGVCILLVLVNGIVYFNLRQTIGQVDGVYSSNLELNKLMASLDGVQQSLYQYLETKSSAALEQYYVYEQSYQDLYSGFNTEITGSQGALLEKNIYNISNTYLGKTDGAVQAKRGRNVSKYKEGYAESQKLYQYLRSSIDTLNADNFQQNSKKYTVLRGSLNSLMVSALVLLTAAMTVAILWMTFITRSITKPLEELAKSANEIACGSIDVGFPIVETGDEVAIVAKACNKMMDSIRDFIARIMENYQREAEHIENELSMKNDLNEAQLRYLQSQINPHFLFNTLNAGAQLAMMEGAEKTCIFIENMADFFRYNVRKTGQETTLAEELELVDSYIYILNVRFAGDIHFEKRVNEKLVQVTMPGMILQPIVENAVNHGIRGMEGDGRILLSVYAQEGDVCVEVSDNGAGIADETIEMLMTSRAEAQQAQSDSPEGGIGLSNVISRLKRSFGREKVFTIEKGTDGVGTTVKIFIPATQTEQKEESSADDQSTGM
ncbi:sensor histidine kinase [Hespellia stercorisuis]|uniref:histidine kinase n=1 Tax=Hespellia stercorisuis DSM 15480 TaxID=1121950 RepID=A0A1M6M6R1_9FIRM|nr:histidine kinase [Hespellia stercorisuis]SHJ78963.1 Phage tail assembly chaperone protein, TAC [Hespellia stercorisuis DSM 15480]